jgi:hypothetical protein
MSCGTNWLDRVADERISSARNHKENRPVPSLSFVRAALCASTILAASAFAAPVATAASSPSTGPAQAPFSFAAAPGHLPKNVVPLDYRIAIVPDVAKRTLRGTASVDLRFDEATDTIQFNALNMRFSACAWTASRSVKSASTTSARSSP